MTWGRVLAALLVAALAACTRVQADGDGALRHPWTIPNTLRVVSGNIPRTLNPILATQTVEAAIARLTTDILISADPHGVLVPRLAREIPTRANGGISADGLTITYHLRAGVRWQDGAPFTSRDVKFTYEAIMNPANDVISRHGYDIVRSVETPDPLTVRFHLRKPFAPLVSVVFGESDSPYGILPAHVLAKYPNLNDVPYNAAPMGTGPFKFVRWVRGDRIEFVSNEHYFLGAPKIKRIIWKFVPDENTEMEQMRSHEADWMYEASVGAYDAIRTIPNVAVVLPNVNGFEGLMMNSGRGATANSRLRRALVMGLDKARLTSDLTYGAGTVATGDLPAFMWAYDPQLRNLPYAPGEARRELAALGYTAAKPLVLDMVYEESQAINRSLAVQIQEELHGIGVEAHARALLSTQIYAGYGAGGTLSRGNYQLAIYQWYAGIDPDNSAQFLCANRPPGGYNQSFYCSPAMDAAQAKALGSYEIAMRKPAYATIESLLVRDAPNPDLHGFDPNPIVETWDIHTWSI
jgi:peptide/nickel transport system substrate-binding protein